MTKSIDLMTDETIMEAVKNGDLQQTSVLFERYNKRIFNFLVRMTMDRDLAEDLTQNVFLRIIKYRGSYKEGMRFQSWIYQVARNIFSDHYQKTKNSISRFTEVEKLGDVMDVEERIDQDEREKLLHKSLAMLNTEQREVLVLTRFQHMKYEEVAVLLDTTETNIKVKVYRAIQKLRELYFQLEEHE